MYIGELNVYPVKSTRGHSVESVDVEPWGLAADRRWMVVDASGTVVTARVFSRLLTVTATHHSPGRVTLERPGAEPVSVDATGDAELVPVTIWRSQLKAAHPSPEADRWFSALLNHDVRLVWLDEPTRRSVNPAHGRESDRVSFADGYPVLLTTTSSLRQLNDWIVADALDRGEPAPDPLPMRRFRPNVVIENDEPFSEDEWTRVQLGDVTFRVAKPCARCVLTTIDPDTLLKGREPIRTLARYRRWDGKVWFGINLIPDSAGTLHVGSPVVPH
ncbi:MOSC domain-containing protein [Phytoactinopolyspora limicola]|uniref:MOSC domain-containing protein n=1 Tax=Phytoactinopolyspora limicola TaxID=2715536 RepID=UPI00140C49EA|nr:MOSC N-terminal beta barrel domain-containing protein [Phytoactinopolyspora limicola]